MNGPGYIIRIIYTGHPDTVATDISESEGAQNMETLQKTPKMQEFLSAFEKIEFQTPQLAANTFVRLCADPEARFLGGRFVDAQHNLREVAKGE